MQLIPEGKIISFGKAGAAPQFPSEIPTVVENWCLIAERVNLVLGLAFVAAVARTMINHSFDPILLFLAFFFLGPTIMKSGSNWKRTMTNFETHPEVIQRYPWNMDMEWLAVITIWILMACSLGSVIGALFPRSLHALLN